MSKDAEALSPEALRAALRDLAAHGWVLLDHSAHAEQVRLVAATVPVPLVVERRAGHWWVELRRLGW